MNQLKQKLRSQSGASITFALLLFLVCAVLSVVILAAATASAGRLAKIGEADQRYYAVTSASAMLKYMIDGKTVSVAEVTQSTNAPGSVSTYVVDGFAAGMSASELASAASVEDTITGDAANRYYQHMKYSSYPLSQSFNLTASDEINAQFNGQNPLNLLITEQTIAENGNIILTVGNANSFQQKLTFSATVSENTSSTSYESIESGSPVTHTTLIHTYALTWALTGVETVGAAIN